MSLWSRLSNAVHGERLNREIDEELQCHIEEAIASGRDPHSPRRLMRGVIALQVAFCVLVLFLSSLFVASFQRLQNRPQRRNFV